MNPFKPPQTNYSNVFDIGKFNFMWRMFVIMLFVFVGLTLLHIFEQDWPDMIITSIACSVILISLFISKITGRFLFSAILSGIIGSLLNQMDLFFVLGSNKAVTILWIISIVFYIFYLLGPKWGITALIVNLTGVLLSIVIIPKEIMIERIEGRTEMDLISMIINLVVIIVLLAYLMNQILKSSRLAEKESKQAQGKLKEQYQLVQVQNEEKTVMLKEIHHRVKNNLQVITSLLRLQSQEIKDPKVLQHFDEAVQRVLAMALIHEKMYSSEELSKIDLEGYLNSLAEELIKSYSVDKPIHLEINCEIDYVQPKSLVSFALMFNELISNTLKHAFSDVNQGVIKIDITRIKEDQVKVTYFDNGTWKPPQREGSFGLQLISDLCLQLDGEFTLSKKDGTSYNFIFDYNHLD